MTALPVVLGGLVIVAIAAAGTWLALKGESESRRPDSESATLSSALEAFQTGDYAGSEAALAAMVSEDGGDLEARRALAQVFAAQGKNAEAIEQYHAVVEADGDDHESLYELGVLERLMGDSLTSITHLEAAVAVEEHEAYLQDLALTYVQVGRYDDAIAAWQKVLDAGRLDETAQAGVYSAIATAYEGMRDYERARSALELAYALAPNDPILKARVESLATP